MSFGRAVGEMWECQPDLTTVEESTGVRVARRKSPPQSTRQPAEQIEESVPA